MSTPTPLTAASFSKHVPAQWPGNFHWLGGIAEDMKQLETSLAQAKADMLDAQSARDKAQMDTVRLFAKCGDLAEQLAAERALRVKKDDALKPFVEYAQKNGVASQLIGRNGAVLYAEDWLNAANALAAKPASAASELAAREEQLATDIACSLYGYFEGDSAGSASAMKYFKNNKTHGECLHLIERVLNQLRAARTTSGEGNPPDRK